jgi:CDP-diacylglycerol--glycerol-3-phosphate 3-phosphatidyltransferase
MKLLPNILSISRMILAVSLFLFRPFSAIFITVYIVAVLTDAADGFLARRFSLQTKIGGDLDTLADFMLVGIMLIRIIPVMDFNILSIAIIISIFALKGLALVVSYIKYKQVISLNTYLSKGLAVVAFLFPFLYWIAKYVLPQLYEYGMTENSLVIFLGGIGILIMLEELLIHLTSTTPRPNAKGFLFDRVEQQNDCHK